MTATIPHPRPAPPSGRVMSPVFVRVAAWGVTLSMADTAIRRARIVSSRRGWQTVATEFAYGGKVSDHIAEITRHVCGPMLASEHEFSHMFRIYEAPLIDRANLDAFARWWKGWES